MPKKKKRTPRAFSILIVAISLFLVGNAIYYNILYWQNYNANIYGSNDPLTTKHKALIFTAQAGLIVIAAGLIVFRKWIFAKRVEMLILLGSLIVCFILVEMISRAYVCNADPAVQSRVLMYGSNVCGQKPMYIPHPYLNYQLTPNYVSKDGQNMHNTLGFRGPEIAVQKPEGVYRIVLIGGSTTYETGVRSWKNDSARWLERELNRKDNTTRIEVINAGVGGWTSYENLISLEFRIIDIQPDMIIVNEGLNDLNERWIDPAYYFPDDTGKRHQWRETDVPLLLRSWFVRLVTGINPGFGVGQFVQNPQHAVTIPKENVYIGKLKGTPLDTLKKNPPVYFEKNLESTIAVAKAHNIEVVLMTNAFTTEFGDYAATPHYLYGFREMNDVIRNVGSKYGVPVYEDDMPEDLQYWSDSVHVNEVGAKVKGELLAQYLLEHNLVVVS